MQRRVAGVLRGSMNTVSRTVTVAAGAILCAQVGLLVTKFLQGVLPKVGIRWLGVTQWVNEVASLALLPVAMLGTALAVRTGMHQGIDLLPRVLPRAGKWALEVINRLVMLAFGVMLTYLGTLYLLANVRAGGTLDTVSWPKWPFYVCYPLAGGLIALFSLERLVERFAGEPVPPAAGAREAVATPPPVTDPTGELSR